MFAGSLLRSRRFRSGLLSCCAALLAPASAASAQIQDWSNLGGNGRCNGLVDVVGPDGVGESDLLWQDGAFSWIAWNPVVEGRRVFIVRQSDFPQNNPPPNDATIYALDLDTGATLWTADLPFEPGDWTTWIAGVKNGRLYASRSGNGGSIAAPVYCLDAATGAILWHTAGGPSPLPPRYEILAGPYTSAVFASDGDIIFGSFRWIERIDAETGNLVWRTSRVEQVGNTTGVVIEGNAVYTADLYSGNRIGVRKIDATTGAPLYRGPLLTGGLLHNGLFIGTDGRIYLNYSQNFNVNSDFLYSFTDTGTEIVQNWRVSSGGGGEFSRWGVGADGSIYSMTWTGTQDFEAQGQLQRLDPATGAVLNTSATITADYMQIHMAVDQRGVLYVSNGNAGGLGGGMLYSFNPDLTERWSMPVTGNLNQGAPVLATDGTLIVASTDTYLRAYRTPRNPCDYDFNRDENIDLLDAQQMAQVFVGSLTPEANWLDGDLNNDENADLTDAQLLAAYVVRGTCGV